MSRNSLRQYFLSVIKLMRPFKWYMIFNGAYLFLLVFEYLNPPAKDDPIFGSVSTLDAWNYVNQEVYVESLKLAVIIFAFSVGNKQYAQSSENCQMPVFISMA